MCGFCHGPLGRGHAALCSMTMLAVLFFVLGAVALVGAWVTEMNGTTWMGFDSDFLIGNAAVFFVLSLMFKMKKRWLKRALMKKMWMGGGCGDSGCGCSSGGACSMGGCDSGSCGTGGCGEAGCGPDCTPEGCGKEGCCKA